jgi:hypothetical protein
VKILLSGMEYLCHSPALFELVVGPGHEPPLVGYDGCGHWRIGSRISWGARLFATRQEASQLIRDIFENAGRENLA